MSSSSVWVQLYYKVENEPKGQPVEIEPIPKNIGALTKATKTELKKELDHAGLTEIFIYSPGTKPPFSQDKALNPWDKIPSNSSGPQPLIVVASAPPQKPGNEINEVIDYVRSQKAEAETLIISEPKTERFNNAMHKFNYRKDAARWDDKPDSFDPPGPPHNWLQSKEDSPENRAEYMAYLRNSDNIRLPQGTQLFEGSLDKELLSVRFLEFGNVKTSGNIDVVLASSHHQSIATIRQNILVGIELKKDKNKEHSKIERQVILQHLAASYLNPDTGILTLMTDLHDRWHFFWFAEGKRLMRYEANRSEAIFLIRHSLDEEGSNERGRISTPTFFLDRACWKDMFSSRLDSISESNLFDERDREADEDSEQRNDGKGRGKKLSEVDGRPVSQQGTSAGSQRTSHQGKSKGCKGSGTQGAQMSDACLEYMDEEERLEATLRREIQTSFHRMLYVPEAEERQSADIVPTEICLR